MFTHISLFLDQVWEPQHKIWEHAGYADQDVRCSLLLLDWTRWWEDALHPREPSNLFRVPKPPRVWMGSSAWHGLELVTHPPSPPEGEHGHCGTWPASLDVAQRRCARTWTATRMPSHSSSCAQAGVLAVGYHQATKCAFRATCFARDESLTRWWRRLPFSIRAS